MDWGGPPGGLERMFAQYDAIVSHHPPAATPSPLEPNPSPSNPGPADEPPWWSPQEMDSPPTSQNEYNEGALKQHLGYDPQKSWGDIQSDRMEAADQRMKEHLANPNGASFEQDENGLTKAYNDETSTGVYYDPQTRTEYVKGSQTAQDWKDDFQKIPFWGNTRDAQRYQEADKAYTDLQSHGKPVDRIVGHSLGGSVALQMQADHGIPKSRTFGAPVLDMKPFDRYYNKADRVRHPLDPVSIFDRGATWGSLKAYPHTYTGFSDVVKA